MEGDPCRIPVPVLGGAETEVRLRERQSLFDLGWRGRYHDLRMGSGDTTCWTVIRGAAGGCDHDREAFARTYEGPVRAYFAARWPHGPFAADVDDACQEVFLDCFRAGGALTRVDPDRGSFRPFLFGVVRNVAHRMERRNVRRRVKPGDAAFDPDLLPAEDEGPSRIFDRALAVALVREAVARQAADAADDAARRRVELLRLRFRERLLIREIAKVWGEEPARVHHAYARARREFVRALEAVVAFHHPGATPGEVRRECRRLVEALG